MCGIVGCYQYRVSGRSSILQQLERALDALKHRGPNDSGVWIDDQSGIAFGHRRLSILDLSSAGRQPMHSRSGRYAIIFNGEIYNHRVLREELAREGWGIDWKGHSDTETILAMIEAYGLEESIKKFHGMFAFALWDLKDRKLFLIRDRVGEKPLYFGWVNSGVVFASELKAFKCFENFNNKISQNSLLLYLRYGYVPAPYSIYEKIFKLPAGSYLTISGKIFENDFKSLFSDFNSIKSIELKKYWEVSPIEDVANEATENSRMNQSKVVEGMLSEIIRKQSLSDVNVGAFLSGGLDSTTIATLLQKQSEKKIQTFTVGFDSESGFNESERAKKISKILGTDHHEIYVSGNEALNIIPKIPCVYDEPFADSSQIPTYLLCAFAKKNITVALSGDGGDEIFGGYNRYLWAPSLWRWYSLLPLAGRRILEKTLENISPSFINGIEHVLNIHDSVGCKVAHLNAKIDKVRKSIKGVRGVDDFYLNLISIYTDPSTLIKYGNHIPEDSLRRKIMFTKEKSIQENMMLLDMKQYLPDDVLCKVDRASMATSLEVRTPFLDHKLIEYVSNLSIEYKISNGRGKLLLRDILSRYLPNEFIGGAKKGFAVPLADWLRGPLREWGESLLAESLIDADGLFNFEVIKGLWTNHQRGVDDNSAILWAILMFQSWSREGLS